MVPARLPLRPMLVFGALVGLLLSSAVGADPTNEIKNWKDLLPEAEFTKLVGESLKQVQEFTRSSTNFNQSVKRLQTEAYSLVTLAEVARRSASGEAERRALAVQAAALELAEAAKKKDQEAAKKAVAALADYKKGSDAKPIGSLADAVPVHNLMEAVQSCYKKHQEYGRLSSAAFAKKGVPEEVATAAYKMAAYSVAITAHVPKSKEDLKDKTPADWLKPTEDMRKATLDIASAAKAKKQSEMKAAIKRMDSACTKCHDNFRIDAE